jgi:hypothetical protein
MKALCQDSRVFPGSGYRPDRLLTACAKMVAAVLRRYPEARNFRITVKAAAYSTPRLALCFTRENTASEQRQIAQLKVEAERLNRDYLDEDF